jgi:hypothetical protein
MGALARAASISCMALACSKPVTFEGSTVLVVLGERAGDPPVRVNADTLVVRVAVELGTGVDLSFDARALLDELVAISRQHRETRKIVFEKTALSDAQARTVVDYLVARGAPEGIAVAGAQEAAHVTNSGDDPAETREGAADQ